MQNVVENKWWIFVIKRKYFWNSQSSRPLSSFSRLFKFLCQRYSRGKNSKRVSNEIRFAKDIIYRIKTIRASRFRTIQRNESSFRDEGSVARFVRWYFRWTHMRCPSLLSFSSDSCFNNTFSDYEVEKNIKTTRGVLFSWILLANEMLLKT